MNVKSLCFTAELLGASGNDKVVSIQEVTNKYLQVRGETYHPALEIRKILDS